MIKRLKVFFTASTVKISLGLAFFKLAKAILAILAVVLSSYYFGTSLDRDTWILGNALIVIIGQSLFGPINEIFRVKFIHISGEYGEEEAQKSTNSLISFLTIISLVIILFIELFPGSISNILASGYTDSQKTTLNIMIRWVIPSQIIGLVTGLWIGVLNAYKSYYLPDLRSIISAVINVICVIIFAPFLSIYSLVLALYISNIYLVYILVKELRKRNIHILKFEVPRIKYIKLFLKSALPFYVVYIFAQIMSAFEKSLTTNLGTGFLSVLDYARKFIDLPLSITLGVINTVLTPVLATFFIDKQFDQFVFEKDKFIRLIIIFTLPLVVLLSICSYEIVNVFLLRGAFQPAFITPTAQTLFCFALGIIGVVFFSINSQALVAQGRGWLTSSIIMGIQVLGLTANIVLYKHFGVVIFAISWSLTHFIGGIIMYLILGKNLIGHTLKNLSTIFLLILSNFILCYIFYKILCLGINNNILKMILIFSISAIFNIAIVLLFKMNEKKYLLQVGIKVKRILNLERHTKQ